MCESICFSCMWVLVCVWTGSLRPWTLQLSSPERQAAPFAPLELRCAHSVTHLTRALWLAGFSTPGGKTGRRGVGLSRAGISRSFHTASHWMHIHNVFDLNVKTQAWISGRKERKCCSHLPSTHLCHKCNWLLKTFTHLSQIVETGDIPSNPVLFFIHLRDAFRPPAPPSLCRWRCHMWQLWSKQGVELPACWYSALFVSYGRTLMRRGSSCSTQTPRQQKSYFIFAVEMACMLRPCSADSEPWTALLYRGREVATSRGGWNFSTTSCEQQEWWQR